MVHGPGFCGTLRTGYGWTCPALLFVALISACGWAPDAPSAAASITIDAAGVSPKELRIKAWSYVTFVNNDTRPHTVLPVAHHMKDDATTAPITAATAMSTPVMISSA